MADDKIIIEFDGDIKKLKAKLETADQQVSKLSRAASSFRSGLGTAAKFGAVAFGALTAAISKSVATYRVQEQAEIKTRATIAATGKAAGLSAEQIFKMASELQNMTTFGDEAIIGGQNLLLTFKNIGEDTFPRATKAMLDMSTAMGTDLQSTAIQMGKALNDPIAGISALSRAGVQFTGQQKEQIKTMQAAGDTAGAQGVILQELESQFGGLAEAAAEGTGGLSQTSNILGDVSEMIGKAALPAITFVNKAIKKMALEFQKSSTGIDNFRDALTGALKVGALFKSIFSTIGKVIAAQMSGISDTVSALVEGSFTKAAQGIKSIYTNSYDAVTEETKLFKENLAEIDKIYDEKKLAQEESKQAKLAELRTKLAEAEKISREEQFNSALEDLNTYQPELDAAELLLLQKKLDEMNQAKEMAQIKELKAAGQHDKALEKLAEIKTKKEIKAAKDKLANEQAWANARVNIMQSTANLITALTKSGSKAAFIAQKAAALAQAYVATNLAAASALAVPPQPNFGLALAAKVAGGINIAAIAATAIQGFAKGGVVTGGMPGVDSVPIMAQRNEIVSPAQSFDELIGSVRAKREAEKLGGTMVGSGIDIEVSFKDNIGDFIEMNILERRALGVSGI